MTRLLAGVIALAISAAALFLATAGGKPDDERRQQWVKIVFGLDGKEARWDGELAIRRGRVLEAEEWGLETRDRLDATAFAWKIESGIPKGPREASFAEPVRGLIAHVEFDGQTEVGVVTQQGQFTFKPAELAAGQLHLFLDRRASVELLGSESLVAETTTDDDFASIAVDREGNTGVAWIAFDHVAKRDHLMVRATDAPRSEPEPIAELSECSHAHLFATPEGLRAVWCAPDSQGNWDVYTAVRERDGWRNERLTSADGTDFQLAAQQGADGTLWLAWQSFRADNGDIFAMRLHKGQWSEEIAVTRSAANEWQPAVAVDDRGNAWIGYDTYEHGNYDVYLTRVSFAGGKPEVAAPTAVATTPDFEAHAALLCENDRVWIAYDAAGPNWGKDFRNIPTVVDGKYAEPLHATRRLELRIYQNGRVLRPTAPLPQQLPPSPLVAIERGPTSKPSRFYELPHLARDGKGRVWLLFRLCRQGYCAHPMQGAVWEIYATTYTASGWLEPILLPRSRGRQNQRVACAVGADGILKCAWSDGNRFASVNRKYCVHVGTLPEIGARPAELPLEPATIDPPQTSEPSPAPAWTLHHRDKDYHLYYGDLHRHTNISRCWPTIDGCLVDAHRYALDAGLLDFLAVTDHTRDVDPYAWWRTQKAADWFHIPGKYVPIYAYERSNTAPAGGHRNVFLLQRGQQVNESEHYYLGRNMKLPNRDPDATLYPWLKDHARGLTAAHTPEFDLKTGTGTWTFNDPQAEPVTEIFQAHRQSYERPGMGVKDEAAVWYALRKGHRLGFIASSDHMSTHMSYACVWATDKSRAAIFEGLQARRTFAATDRIAVEFRIGPALMGEEVTLDGKDVTLAIRARGTAPIDEIEIVRSGKVIQVLKPGREESEISYTDNAPEAGTSYYYVRLQQRGGGLAWASPIWVRR